MAALQSIRKRGGCLLLIIGLGLFAFIAGDYFKAFDIFKNDSNQKVGEIFGETLKYPEYQQKVDELTEISKFLKLTQGQDATLTDQEQDQIRQQVWENFAKAATIKEEAGKLGLIVTDEDVENALVLGQAYSLQLLARIFPNQTNGTFDFAQYQNFLKDYDKNLANFRNQRNEEAIQQYQQIRTVCDFSYEQLKEELLENKFYMLLGQSIISNKVLAKYEFDQRNQLADALIACIPYNSVTEKDAKVEDADIKALYDKVKHQTLFRNPTKSADLSLIDVAILPSDSDRVAQQREIEAIAAQFAAGEDVATVVANSKTVQPYVNLAQSEKAFAKMPDVVEAIKTMAVGSVKPAYFNEQDNTFTTLKLVNKIQASDSVQYSAIFAPAQTAEESVVLADSIYQALQGGEQFAELAKKYGQTGDSVWVTGASYEGSQISADDAAFFNALNTLPTGYHKLTLTQGTIVLNVIKKASPVTKYNVAVVKCPLTFSKQTYNAALNQLNRFMASNHDIDSFIKNAGKEGYTVQPVDVYTQDNLSIQLSIGGSSAKDALKWVFDEAKAGEVSRIYECGRNNDHLLVVGVRHINKGDILPLENETVKGYLTKIALRNKQEAILLKRLEKVANFEQASQQPGVLTDTLKAQNLYTAAQIKAIGVPEPKVNGILANLENGKSSGAIAGAAGVYYTQVVSKDKGTEEFNVENEKRNITNRVMQTIYSSNPYSIQAQEVLLQEIISKFGKVKNNLYRF